MIKITLHGFSSRRSFLWSHTAMQSEVSLHLTLSYRLALNIYFVYFDSNWILSCLITEIGQSKPFISTLPTLPSIALNVWKMLE